METTTMTHRNDDGTTTKIITQVNRDGSRSQSRSVTDEHGVLVGEPMWMKSSIVGDKTFWTRVR